MRSRFLCSVFLFVAAACSDNGTAQTDAQGACTCTAETVSYDHSSSTLGASNVQDAVDELAARPIPEPPIGPRVKTIVVPFTLTDQAPGIISKAAACPNESVDVVLGGACGAVGTTNYLLRTDIANSSTEAKFSCGYAIPETITATSSVTVVCLANAK
jgi:hypothetical protein